MLGNITKYSQEIVQKTQARTTLIKSSLDTLAKIFQEKLPEYLNLESNPGFYDQKGNFALPGMTGYLAKKPTKYTRSGEIYEWGDLVKDFQDETHYLIQIPMPVLAGVFLKNTDEDKFGKPKTNIVNGFQTFLAEEGYIGSSETLESAANRPEIWAFCAGLTDRRNTKWARKTEKEFFEANKERFEDVCLGNYLDDFLRGKRVPVVNYPSDHSYMIFGFTCSEKGKTKFIADLAFRDEHASDNGYAFEWDVTKNFNIPLEKLVEIVMSSAPFHKLEVNTSDSPRM